MRKALLLAFFIGGAAALALSQVAALREPAFWRQQASPGALSAAHAFLEDDCAACHTPIKGVEAASCIVCHANDTALLQRQATAFHASIAACADCHGEHAGRAGVILAMNHAALAEIGLRQLASDADDSEATLLHHQLVSWIAQRDGVASPAPDNPHISATEHVLDCATCHASGDPHGGLFGRDCVECHATEHWTLAEFRHPPPSSLECAQCHQAPLSHYMEHFRMVSMRVAEQEHAEVRQCYLCHQTTGWNDIRGVGFYDHH